MARRRPLKIGDLVKITEFGGWYEGPPDVMWGRVTDLSEGGTHYADVTILAIKGPGAVDNIGDNDWRNWPLDNDDKFTVVPESRVPNWVWAQVAKRALTGEH